MKNQIPLYALFVLILFPILSYTQDTLDLVSNPSFEAEAKRGPIYEGYHIDEFIDSWFDCGLYNFPGESQPDILSEESEFWNVRHLPSDGDTYLGLVVRDNGTWESVTQRLKEKLEVDRCYQFTIDLSKAHKYLSGSRLTNKTQDYIAPAILKIWIGDNYCDLSQVVYTSPPIGRNEWKSHEVVFQAESNFEYLTIQAFFINEGYPQSGNILVDNISEFIVSKCE